MSKKKFCPLMSYRGNTGVVPCDPEHCGMAVHDGAGRTCVFRAMWVDMPKGH